MQPPTPQPLDQPAQDYAYGAPPAPPKWSALAIAAFVLSLLGFFGFTAILGIILGIAGIVVTKGGRRRGLGLAVAAIPISVVMGVISVLLLITIVVGMRYSEIKTKIEPALKSEVAGSVDALAEIREVASAGFNEAVGDSELRGWLEAVRQKHGKLVEIKIGTPPYTQGAVGEPAAFNFTARFVNGTASVQVHIKPEDMMSMRFSDITVDGVSPRKAD